VANCSGSSIKFQDVVSVIGKFAFIVTPYPLILSMEIHCGPEQQLKMAQIFRETLGDELLLGNLEGFTGGKLPSPEDLKYKILLKVGSHLVYTNNRSKTLLRTWKKSPRMLVRYLQSPARIRIPLYLRRASALLSVVASPLVNLPPASPRKLSLHSPIWQSTRRLTSGETSSMPTANCSIMSLVFPNQKLRSS
jgi:hypothetical protein